jgi:hypothetical protein
MDRRTRTATAVLAPALVAAGCSGDAGGGGDNRSLTVWTIEDGADRVAAQQKRAPLSDFYDPDVLTAVQTSPSTFARWGLPEGQGELVRAMQGPLPVAEALADLVAGTGSAAGAARRAQQAVEDLN